MARPDASPPNVLPTPPESVQQRLARQALVVRSLWFPTRRELVEWGRSGCPVWFMPLGPGRFLTGPRLGAMWASVFSPCLRAEIRPEGDGSRVEWRRTWPPLTRAVLGIWAVLVTGWGGAIALGMHPGGLLWWAIVTGGTAAAPLVGSIRGGIALAGTIPWLTDVVSAPDDEEDW